MSYFGWRPYVPVAEKRRQAERKLAKLKKQGQSVAPVKIDGRTIAKSFWGKSWCGNLERYSDYENRLPRGRTYVRNGSVVDLKITTGEVDAMVAGTKLYEVKIAIKPVTTTRWKAICRDCAGTIDLLVELLQGRLAKGVMDRICREGDGLFPAPGEIQLSCSCPDWADMCKHVAAVLYGVGARLDEMPRLLFVLRDVDESELLASVEQDLPLTRATLSAEKVLDDSDVAALFGPEMTETARVDAPAPTAPKLPPRSNTPSKKPAQSRSPAVKKRNSSRMARTKPEPKRAVLMHARKAFSATITIARHEKRSDVVTTRPAAG